MSNVTTVSNQLPGLFNLELDDFLFRISSTNIIVASRTRKTNWPIIIVDNLFHITNIATVRRCDYVVWGYVRLFIRPLS